ncbi:hypothetical protein ABTM69_20585, partial [Acinetobacter baumannii]
VHLPGSEAIIGLDPDIQSSLVLYQFGINLAKRRQMQDQMGAPLLTGSARAAAFIGNFNACLLALPDFDITHKTALFQYLQLLAQEA